MQSLRLLESVFRDRSYEDRALWSTFSTAAQTVYEISQPMLGLYHDRPDDIVAALQQPQERTILPIYYGALIRYYRLFRRSADARHVFESQRSSIEISDPMGTYFYVQWATHLATIDGAHLEALDILLDCELTLRTVSAPHALAYTISLTASCLMESGDLRAATARLTESHEIIEQLGEPQTAFRTLLNIASLYTELRCLDDAHAVLMSLVDRVELTTMTASDLSHLYGALTTVDIHRGDFASASHWVDQHDALAREHGVAPVLALNSVYRAEIAYRRGDHTDAAHIAAAMGDESVAALGPHARIRYEHVSGLIHHANGDMELARMCFSRALEQATSTRLSHRDHVDLYRDALQRQDMYDSNARQHMMQGYISLLEEHNDVSGRAATRILELRTSYYQRLAELERERHESHQREIEEVANSILDSVSTTIHDKVGQDLALVGLDLDVILGSTDLTSDIQTKVAAARQRVTRVSRDLRVLAHHVSANTLETHGLTAALRELLSDVNTAAIHAQCTITTTASMSHDDDYFMYRCAHILVSNVLRHAGASHVSLQLIDTPTERQLIVDDNGRGFNPQSMHTGMGYRELRARVSMRRAKLHVDTVLGIGSTIMISLPLDYVI